MLPLLVRTANICGSIVRHKTFRNLFLITANSQQIPHQTIGYPQIFWQISTIYKSLAPCSQGNTHRMCERNIGLKFGEKPHEIRCRLDGNHGRLYHQKGLLMAGFRASGTPKTPPRPRFRLRQSWFSNTSLHFTWPDFYIGDLRARFPPVLENLYRINNSFGKRHKI